MTNTNTQGATKETVRELTNRLAAKYSKLIINRWKGTPSELIDRLDNCLDVNFEGNRITFETPLAETIVKSAVQKALTKEAYDMLFPPCYMDINGNYTYDSSKWV